MDKIIDLAMLSAGYRKFIDEHIKEKLKNKKITLSLNDRHYLIEGIAESIDEKILKDFFYTIMYERISRVLRKHDKSIIIDYKKNLITIFGDVLDQLTYDLLDSPSFEPMKKL